MGFFSFLGVLSPVHIGFVTMVSGATHVGTDATGNRYFRAKARKGYKRERRWVLYKGAPEASKVPPEWHGWLHYQSDMVPSQTDKSYRREWQVPHQQNMTGTTEAYRPPGHILEGGKRDKATGDYEAWNPNE
jgi:NADH:ubiquinone oxidoreductase subunit